MGEEIEDLLFSLEKSSIQFIATRHEQGAAFIAWKMSAEARQRPLGVSSGIPVVSGAYFWAFKA